MKIIFAFTKGAVHKILHTDWKFKVVLTLLLTWNTIFIFIPDLELYLKKKFWKHSKVAQIKSSLMIALPPAVFKVSLNTKSPIT